MKRLLLISALLTLPLAAFAQGTLTFNNDSLHLVYFNPDASALAPGDAAHAGQPVVGQNLAAELWVGLSPGSLSLMASTPFSTTPGEWVSSNVSLGSYSPGTTFYFQVKVHDQLDPYAGYSGNSVVFSGAPGLASHQLTDFWPAGSYPIPGSPGERGAIMLSYVAAPEPSTAGLLGLGVLALGIWRRRARL